MADYDNAEITERERLAAEHQKEIAAFNAAAAKQTLQQQLDNYDFANRQNRRLADVELKQNSRKSESDRFNALRDLQNAALGIMGSMGNAMNGSATYNLLRMLENRNDRDNDTYWTQLQVNQDQVNNAYEESANQNQVAKNDASINAEQALKGMEGDLSANLNNINPNLYMAPETREDGSNASGSSGSSGSSGGSGAPGTEENVQLMGDEGSSSGTDRWGGNSSGTDLGGNGFYDAHRVQENMAELSGYLMPDNSVQAARDIAPRNRLRNDSYFNRLMNRFNGRY